MVSSCSGTALATTDCQTDRLTQQDTPQIGVGTPDRLTQQATVASKKRIPAARGSMERLVTKKPSACSPEGTSGLGQIKLLTCSHKSYILQFNSQTKKWPLVANCEKPDHVSVMTALFKWCQEHPTASKEDVVHQKNMMCKKT